jgi:hypothetical protein
MNVKGGLNLATQGVVGRWSLSFDPWLSMQSVFYDQLALAPVVIELPMLSGPTTKDTQECPECFNFFLREEGLLETAQL